MDPILYNAASGGRDNFKRQEIIANNLANANTPGFRADLYQAQTMYVQGASGDSSFGQAFTTQNPNAIDFTPGALIATDRNLDVAVNGNGWIALRDSTGKESYSKAGSLRLNANGQLVTSSGKAVVGSGGPISIPPAQSVDVGSDGTISIVPLGGDAKSATIVDRIKLVTLDKNNITKNAEGLFQLKTGGMASADPNVTLVSGMLEGSNVQAVEELVAMITAGRDFENHTNILSTVSENAQKLTQVLHE